jgi:hypothetical protein
MLAARRRGHGLMNNRIGQVPIRLLVTRAREGISNTDPNGVLCSGNGCSACAVPELAVSRLPSLVVGRL